jgi:hypothetical protein
MKLALAAALFVTACMSNGGGGGGGNGSATSFSGTISSDTTWGPGAFDVTGPVTINAGATLTVAAGTQISMVPNAGFTVSGTLDASAGTKASPITILPSVTGQHFLSTKVDTGGMVTFSYVTQRGGGFGLSGTAMISDSEMSNMEGDFMVVDAGTLDMEYSQIGLGAPNSSGVGNGDTTHCNFHINDATSITVNNTNVAGSPYGVMLYTIPNANFKANNFYGNTYDFEPSESGMGSIDGSWFSSGAAPAQTGVSGTVATSPVAAGPR